MKAKIQVLAVIALPVLVGFSNAAEEIEQNANAISLTAKGIEDANGDHEMHPLIYAFEFTSGEMGIFAANAAKGIYRYETCPLAVSFYRRGVKWRVIDNGGIKSLLDYVKVAGPAAESHANRLMVINAMSLDSKRLLVEAIGGLIDDAPGLGDANVNAPKYVEEEWEWGIMTLREFYKQVEAMCD